MDTDGLVVVGIDPGVSKSAVVLLEPDDKIAEHYYLDNAVIEPHLQVNRLGRGEVHIAIEWIQHYGGEMRAGKDVFDTCRAVGRMQFAAELNTRYVTTIAFVQRGTAKLHVCGRTNVGDADVRQALIDKWGGKEKAIGGIKCKKCHGKGWFGAGRPVCTECNGAQWEIPPGPLYGFTGTHKFAALAVALCRFDELCWEEVCTDGASTR